MLKTSILVCFRLSFGTEFMTELVVTCSVEKLVYSALLSTLMFNTFLHDFWDNVYT